MMGTSGVNLSVFGKCSEWFSLDRVQWVAYILEKIRKKVETQVYPEDRGTGVIYAMGLG